MAEPIGMYEFAFIVDGVLSEDKIKDVVGKMSEFVKENGCKVIAVDEMGMKRMAHTIHKRNNGYYVVLYFEGPGSFIGRLERAAEINEQILRYLTLKYDAKMKRAYESRVSGTKAEIAPRKVVEQAD